MGSSQRQRGDYFERQARDALRAIGWVVVRSAGSLGPADLVAMRQMIGQPGRPHVLLVSCKINGRISGLERAQLSAMAEQACAEPVVALRPKNGTVQLVSLDGKAMVRAELRVPSKPRHRKDDEPEPEAQAE